MFHLSVLDQEEIDSIHHASLKILEETGVVLTEPRSRAILQEAGARIRDRAVLFPAELVEKCISINR